MRGLKDDGKGSQTRDWRWSYGNALAIFGREQDENDEKIREKVRMFSQFSEIFRQLYICSIGFFMASAAICAWKKHKKPWLHLTLLLPQASVWPVKKMADLSYKHLAALNCCLAPWNSEISEMYLLRRSSSCVLFDPSDSRFFHTQTQSHVLFYSWSWDLKSMDFQGKSTGISHDTAGSLIHIGVAIFNHRTFTRFTYLSIEKDGQSHGFWQNSIEFSFWEVPHQS